MNINDITEEGRTPLHLSCGRGRFDTVKLLLNRRVDTTIKDIDGYTALHQACVMGDTNVVDLLIDVRMDMNVKSKNGLIPFLCACWFGHYDTVKFLILKYVNTSIRILNITSTDNVVGFSALHAACRSGNLQIVQLLMVVGMDINCSTNRGFTPLYIASKEGHHDIVTFLLYYKGQTLNSRIGSLIKESVGLNDWHGSCSFCRNVNKTGKGYFEPPRILLCEIRKQQTIRNHLYGINLNSRVASMIKDSKGWTALHVACYNGHTEVVKILIDAGMNVNDTTFKGCTPLFLACCEGRYDTVNCLLDLNSETAHNRVDFMIKDLNGGTALHAACKYGHTEVVTILINNGMNVNDTTNEGFTPLNISCREGHLDTIKFLVNLDGPTVGSRVDLKAENIKGWTALHTSCFNGHTDIVKLLIDVGMNVNDTTNEGFTSLFLACIEGHFNTVKFLLYLNGQNLKSQIDLMVKDLEGGTALHAACNNGNKEVVKILIDAGMNVNDTTIEKFTPLFIVCRHGHLDTVTFSLGINDQILKSSADLMAKDSEGFTVLHRACYKGHTNLVNMFIDSSINVNDTTNEGFTPLFLASRGGHYDIVKYLLDLNSIYEETVDIYRFSPKVSHRVDTGMTNDFGSTALHVASSNGHTKIVKLLVDIGMNINDATKLGFTPLYLACQRGHYDTVKFLLDLNCRSVNRDLNNSKTDSSVNTSLSNLPSSVNTTIKDPLEMSVLHIACLNGYAEVAKLLIDAGIDINERRYDGNTALYLACLKGHCCVVKTLMDNGAQTDMCDKQTISPLIIAHTNGHTDIVTLLEKLKSKETYLPHVSS